MASGKTEHKELAQELKAVRAYLMGYLDQSIYLVENGLTDRTEVLKADLKKFHKFIAQL